MVQEQKNVDRRSIGSDLDRYELRNFRSGQLHCRHVNRFLLERQRLFDVGNLASLSLANRYADRLTGSAVSCA